MTFLDTNIILELLFDRAMASSCWGYLGQAIDDMGVSIVSVSTVMYFVEKHKLDKQTASEIVHNFSWLGSQESDIHWAFANYAGSDFEDALQVAVALRERCTAFVTLDKELAAKYGGKMKIVLL